MSEQRASAVLNLEFCKQDPGMRQCKRAVRKFGKEQQTERMRERNVQSVPSTHPRLHHASGFRVLKKGLVRV